MDTWKRAQNLQTLTLQEGAFVGRLEDFQFDLETHRIYGWAIKGGGVFPKAGGVESDGLVLIGRDAAFITAQEVVEWGIARRNKADGRAWATAYRGTPAMTRRGESLGAVQDFIIDRKGTQVTGLILHGDQVVALDDRVHTGPSAVIVENMGRLVPLSAEDAEHPDWWERLKDKLGVGKTGEAPPKAGEAPPKAGEAPPKAGEAPPKAADTAAGAVEAEDAEE